MSNIFHSTSSLIHSATTFYICYSLWEKMAETEPLCFQGKPLIWKREIFPCCGSNLQNSRSYTGWKVLGLLTKDQEDKANSWYY